nr:putative zinc finger, CCHC-type [Tanacetum cinerariifolium]
MKTEAMSLTMSRRMTASIRQTSSKKLCSSSRALRTFTEESRDEVEQLVSLSLSSDLPRHCLAQGYTYIRFGAIRLALTFHGRKGLHVYSRIALLDKRFVEYQHACIGTIQTTLNAGTIVVTFYPNFNMPLNDPSLLTSLKAQFQIGGTPQVNTFQATFHYQMAYRVQNHSLDILVPGQDNAGDALLIDVDSNTTPTCTYVPRKLSQDKLVKLLLEKWITNYEQIHQAPVRSTSAPEFMRHENGMVEIKFSSSQPKSDNVFPTGIRMITPTYQEPAQEVKHVWWDVCNCESCIDEAAKISDDEDLPRKQKPLHKNSKEGMRKEIIQIIQTSPTTQHSSSISQKEAEIKNLKNQLQYLEQKHKQKRITSLIDDPWRLPSTPFVGDSFDPQPLPQSYTHTTSPSLNIWASEQRRLKPPARKKPAFLQESQSITDVVTSTKTRDVLLIQKVNPVSMFLNSLTDPRPFTPFSLADYSNGVRTHRSSKNQAKRMKKSLIDTSGVAKSFPGSFPQRGLNAVIFLIHQSPCATLASRMLLFPNLVLLQYLLLTFFLNHLNLVLNPRTEPCTAAKVNTMTCHPPIFPAATCTVPRIQLLAASRRHVVASYRTVASDVAATSAPVNAVGQRRSTPPVTGQRRRITMVIDGQRWRSTTVTGGGPPLTAAGPQLTTTRPPVNGKWVMGLLGEFVGCSRDGERGGKTREKGFTKEGGKYCTVYSNLNVDLAPESYTRYCIHGPLPLQL